MNSPERFAAIEQWLRRNGYADFQLQVASEDASFRRYWRLCLTNKNYIVMDAPPEQESCVEFIDIANRLRQAGLSAPEIILQDLSQGFLLLTDFGAADYLSSLDQDSEAGLYSDAIKAIVAMQTSVHTEGLPVYDELLLSRELALFHDWFLMEQCGITLSPQQTETWRSTQEILIQNFLKQPQAFVHRDFHSRNLMVLDSGNPGILDFQDANIGPLSYDLVSLLRDCYIDWPHNLVEAHVSAYFDLACSANIVQCNFAEFMTWFNLTGIQRHLKAIGIFCRLNIRDSKPGYLADIPRTFSYVNTVANLEPDLAGFSLLIKELELDQHISALDR